MSAPRVTWILVARRTMLSYAARQQRRIPEWKRQKVHLRIGGKAALCGYVPPGASTNVQVFYSRQPPYLRSNTCKLCIRALEEVLPWWFQLMEKPEDPRGES